MIRVVLPPHLRTLAGVDGPVELAIAKPVTARRILDALEGRYPVLAGTIRDHGSHRRRDFVRFFVCQDDWSHVSPDEPVPEAVAEGREPFIVLGALAGG